MQMTTDTAVRVTRTIIQENSVSTIIGNLPSLQGCTYRVLEKLSEIPYIDSPEIRINEHESTEMPFRYMADTDGLPIMPKVSLASYFVYSRLLVF